MCANIPAYVGTSAIQELADAIFPLWSKARFMAMLAGYFDESGTAKDARILSVGGYIAPVDQWKRFQSEWWKVLSKAGLDPSVTPFHMAEFEARKQPHMKGKTPFAEWSDKKANAVLQALLGVIRKRAAIGVVAAVLVEDYEAVKGAPAFAPSRYHFCVTRCLIRTSRWALDNGVTGSVAYVFEDGACDKDEVFKHEVNRAAAEYLADEDFRRTYLINSLSFESKLKFFPLQAADILAWEARRHCLSGGFRTVEGLRPSLHSLLSGLPHISEYYDQQELQRFATHFEEKRKQAKGKGP